MLILRKSFVVFLTLSFFVLISLSGCRQQKERRNLGVDDGINSFLYNFDSRDEVAALVKEVKKGNLPAEISWHYDRNIMAKKNHKVPLRSSSDQEFINNAYYALGDAIVVGIANNQSPKTPIDLTFTFADGSSCTFYFVQENTVRISGQNYVLEDGGKLWRLLADVSGSAETESEVFAETELEVTAETKSEIIVETESEAESEAITEAE